MMTKLLIILFVVLLTIVSAQMGGLKIITAESDPTAWYRARDTALLVKEKVIADINANSFSLTGESEMYSFDLIQLGLQQEKDYVFYMKVQVDGYNYAHLRVYQEYPGQAWTWPLPQLMATQYVKSLNDTVGYFENDEFIHI
eukprot:197828_1